MFIAPVCGIRTVRDLCFDYRGNTHHASTLTPPIKECSFPVWLRGPSFAALLCSNTCSPTAPSIKASIRAVVHHT